MNDALVMGLFHRSRDLSRDVDHPPCRQWCPVDRLSERVSLDELEHQKVLTVVFLEAMDSGDIGVIEGAASRCASRSKRARAAHGSLARLA